LPSFPFGERTALRQKHANVVCKEAATWSRIKSSVNSFALSSRHLFLQFYLVMLECAVCLELQVQTCYWERTGQCGEWKLHLLTWNSVGLLGYFVL